MNSFVSQTDSLRILPLRTSSSRLPLFCITGIGGSAEIFATLVTCLPDDRPVYAIDIRYLPKMHGSLSVEQLAPHYLRAMRELQPKGPYHMVGHSFGGLVAYEVACRMLVAGEDVAVVALLDADCPTFASNLRGAESVHYVKTYVSDRLKKYARNLLSGEFKAFTTDAIAFLAPRAGFISAALVPVCKWLNRPLPSVFRYNDRAFEQAYASYAPPPYAGKLVLFRSEDRGPEFDGHPSMGWDVHATGALDVHVVPGDHVDMMSSQNVGVVAERMKAYLT